MKKCLCNVVVLEEKCGSKLLGQSGRFNMVNIIEIYLMFQDCSV
jgi:hypothetical protein